MTLKVVNAGVLSTVQDLGRIGYQNQGFSSAGAIDYQSHMLANRLLGNDVHDATIEMTLQGSKFEVLADTAVAVAGANMEIKVNNQPVSAGTVIHLAAGDQIDFGIVQTGLRAYLALPGGVDVPLVLGSRSTHTRSGIGGYQGRALKVGDIIESIKPAQDQYKYVVDPVEYSQEIQVRIIAGQQYDSFTDISKVLLTNTSYEVTKDTDRMGIRLSGEGLKNDVSHDVISEPTQLGSIQVPSSGDPIILLNDRQTAGGYARIATVALVDIPLLAQLRPGDRIRFSLIDVNHATLLYKQLMEKIDRDELLLANSDFESQRRRVAEKVSQLL